MHVGASLLYTIGRRFGYTGHQGTSRLLLAGGAAGIAAAFNAPLAGVVFAIEELSSRFEHRFSGTLLTAVIVGGVVSLGLIGSYTYFGRVEGALPLGAGWLAVPLCGIACGLAGGLFMHPRAGAGRGSTALVRRAARTPPGAAGRDLRADPRRPRPDLRRGHVRHRIRTSAISSRVIPRPASNSAR